MRFLGIVTLHVPKHDDTCHLLTTEGFSRMKGGVTVINTTRRTILDTQSFHALKEGNVAATGLDVLCEEPVVIEEAGITRKIFQKKHDLKDLLTDHVFLHMRNVYKTPYSAFFTCRAIQRNLGYNN